MTQHRAMMSEEQTETFAHTVPISATIHIAHIEPDCVYGGEDVIRIDVGFSLTGLRNPQVNLTAMFLAADGTPLPDTDGQYCTSGGKVATWDDVRLDEDHKEDTKTLYLPHEQLHLPAGRHRLQCYTCIRQVLASGDWFLSQQIAHRGPGTNWNAANVRILERNWFAVSWQVRPTLRLAQLVRGHLDAFREKSGG